ncbi:MAG: formamidopyrimidine-DNA glycosylase [Acidimicrobiaceae bacterium]|nr:formamidopyrimidine-DNA glycosylase [Acidimicrobiaceae bacterium]
MPEIIEVEAYRRAISATEGRTIARVHAPDEWFAKDGTTTDALRLELTGARIEETRRIGKLVIVDTDGPRLGLRFGMTGKIVVDGAMPIDHLLYDSPRHEPAWDRFGLEFEGGGAMVLRDPRRLGGVQLEPDESKLGPDALSLTLGQLRKALGDSTVALKARLLDQRRVAGLGNLLVDEALWRAGLSPVREARSLDARETARLHRNVRRTLAVLGERGGSHTGDLQPGRERGGGCPRDGAALRREQVGGRTTYWCPDHQT